MTTFETLLSRHNGTPGQPAFASWDRARELFDQRRYADAARVLDGLLTQLQDETRDESHVPASATGAAAARLLLARAYYHSAQLARAIETTQAIVEDDPGDAYARLLLSRALERSGRPGDAATHRRIAEAMGVAA